MYLKEIACVMDSLQHCQGQLLQKIKQPRPDRISLSFSNRTHLLFVPRGPFARFHPVRDLPTNPARPFQFQSACRAHLRGRLLNVDWTGNDRLFSLHFHSARLLLRLTGRTGGLWLFKDERLIAQLGRSPPVPPTPLTSDRIFTPSEPRFCPESIREDPLRADDHFSSAEALHWATQARATERRRLQRDLKRSRRLTTHLQADLSQAHNADSLRQVADSLAASLYLIKDARGPVSFSSLYSAQRLSVNLRGKKPGVFLSQLYRRVDKKVRAQSQVSARLQESEETTARLVNALSHLAERPLVPLNAPALPEKARVRSRHPARCTAWLSERGRTVYIGRDAQANHALCARVARADDLWFHLRGLPSAHLLLRLNKGESADLDELIACARLLLRVSRVKTDTFTDVQYTQARFVRLASGARPGRVHLLKERVIRVKASSDELIGWTQQH